MFHSLVPKITRFVGVLIFCRVTSKAKCTTFIHMFKLPSSCRHLLEIELFLLGRLMAYNLFQKFQFLVHVFNSVNVTSYFLISCPILYKSNEVTFLNKVI